MSAVKIMGGPIKNPPKPTSKAEIKGQGSIPYDKTAEAPMTAPGGVARGMGAATRGGNYKGCGSDASS